MDVGVLIVLGCCGVCVCYGVCCIVVNNSVVGEQLVVACVAVCCTGLC